MKTRLTFAVISTILEEVALYAIWRWGLPQLDIHLHLAVLIVVMVAWAAYAVTNFWLVTQALKKETVLGLPAMVGSRGKVVSPLAPEGQIRIKSEIWGAKSNVGNIDKGEEVLVVGQDGLKLIVRRSNDFD